MSEVAFESLAAAIETTRGTAVTPPTHWIPLAGTMQPEMTYYEPEEQRGALVKRFRQQLVRNATTWSASGGADPRYLPFLLNMVTGPGVITTPTNGILTRLHTHTPSVTTDTVKTVTMFFGDANIQIWRADFAFCQNFSITADASGTDGATMSMSGMGSEFFAATPTLPSQTIGSILVPGTMQMWIDTTFAFGTTAVTGRLISASLNIDTGIIPKYLANGLPTVTSILSYTRLGRGRPDVSCTFQLEVPDTTQMAQAIAATLVKVRIRINGDQIEAVTPTYNEYVEWDVYGRLKFDSWSELEGVNRTANFRIDSIYETGMASSYSIKVQNQSAVI
jgi:hypothetical protein